MASDARLAARLATLEARWDALNAPVAGHLAGGLDDAAIASALGTRHLAAPIEVVTWFGWHNGPDDPIAKNQPGPHQANWQMTPDFWSIDLDHALTLWDTGMAFREDVLDSLPQDWWNAAWIPIALSSYGPIHVLDSDVPPLAPSPVHIVDWEQADFSWLVPVTTSLAELIDVFIAAIDGGRWTWDADEREWQRDAARPPHLQGLLASVI